MSARKLPKKDAKKNQPGLEAVEQGPVDTVSPKTWLMDWPKPQMSEWLFLQQNKIKQTKKTEVSTGECKSIYIVSWSVTMHNRLSKNPVMLLLFSQIFPWLSRKRANSKVRMRPNFPKCSERKFKFHFSVFNWLFLSHSWFLHIHWR